MEEQPRFLNAVLGVETQLNPLGTLDALKAIEQELGRTDRGRYGPREIDLDIVVHGDARLDTERLTVPHARAPERAFVMRPLLEAFHKLGDDVPSGPRFAVEKLATEARQFQVGDDGCRRSVLGRFDGDRTLVMGILNATPDSFSDGGKYFDAGPLSTALRHAEAMVLQGADIVDVGGESTRPGATPVSESEEIDRVVPLVRALKESLDVAISIDTRRARVARAAVEAGASIVNDVSGGAFDPSILDFVRERPDIAYVATHSRGTPETMQSLAVYSDDIIGDILEDMRRTAFGPLSSEVAPWRVLVDPGIGFAKTYQQNLSILRRLADLKEKAAPFSSGLLLGPSRKAFLGQLLQAPHETKPRPADDRDWATAGACSAIVPHADILRVHNVRGIKDAIAAADAILRRGEGGP